MVLKANDHLMAHLLILVMWVLQQLHLQPLHYHHQSLMYLLPHQWIYLWYPLPSNIALVIVTDFVNQMVLL
jgi:hypothetical protein